jgi:hypothetical protein
MLLSSQQLTYPHHNATQLTSELIYLTDLPQLKNLNGLAVISHQLSYTKFTIKWMDDKAYFHLLSAFRVIISTLRMNCLFWTAYINTKQLGALRTPCRSFGCWYWTPQPPTLQSLKYLSKSIPNSLYYGEKLC